MNINPLFNSRRFIKLEELTFPNFQLSRSTHLTDRAFPFIFEYYLLVISRLTPTYPISFVSTF